MLKFIRAVSLFALAAACAMAQTAVMRTATKADILQAGLFCADAGSTDAYACNLSPAVTAYVTGTHYRFKANTANTGAASINFNAVGALTIKKPFGGSITTDLADNDVRVGQWVECVYDGTNCQMVSQLGNAPGGSGTVTTSGSPAIHQVAVFGTATAITGVAVGSTDKPLVGVTAGDPAFSKLTLTNPATVATLTIADNKTVTINNTLTVNSTDGITMTTPTTSFTAARTDAANTFTGVQTMTSPVFVTPALGTPASGVATNLTGTAAGLTAGITNALKSATTTVDVSAATAPSANQVLTATDSTHATWQAATGGGTGNAASVVTATFSATPTFTCPSSSAGTITNFKMSTALTANVTSSTLASCTTGQIIDFTLIQDATGGRTFAWPTGFGQACTVNATASATTNASFYWDGTNAQMISCGSDSGPAGGAESAAPSGSPGAGTFFEWFDSTNHVKSSKNSSGTVANMVVPDTGATNNFITAVSAAGVISKAQPAFSNLSGSATAGQLPGTLTSGTAITNAALTTPAITGLATGSGVSAAATASTLATRDSSANLSANSLLDGYTTTATAAGTTTLTVASTKQQYFTGATTQTVTLPVTSTLALGQQFWITNASTGAVTVNSSGANAVLVMAGGTKAHFTVILTSGTTAASWSANYFGDSVATGKVLTVSNSFTATATDGSTVALGAGGTVLYSGGALGTPASGTLTNATGLPISTGVSGLGANVAAFLAAPSGANFNAMITGGGVEIPQNSKSAAYTTVLGDCEHSVYHPGADTTARTWTIDSNANVAAPIGCTITFVNDTSAGIVTIAITSDTLVLAGAGTTGSRTLAANGIATATKITSTRWMISGTGLT